MVVLAIKWLIYLDAGRYQFLFLPVKLMILLYLVAPFYSPKLFLFGISHIFHKNFKKLS